MSLISYTQLEDNTPASANSINNRFAPLYDEVNGNLDVQNLKNGAVTEPKLGTASVTASKLGSKAVLPSKMGNVWVGKSSSKYAVGKSEYTAFNKTISLSEASYIYVLYNASGNANSTSARLDLRLEVNGTDIYALSSAGALELWNAKRNMNFPFSVGAITQNKLSGNINVKVIVKSNEGSGARSAGIDLDPGFVRIDALGDDTYLG